MKIKSRILSFFLAVVLLVMSLPLTAFPVSAAEIIDDIPKLTSPSVGTLKYLTSTSRYAYAKEDITPESSYKLKWDDVTDYYTVYVKALDNDPNPGDEEPGELLYNKQASNGFSKNYLTISQSYLEDCVGKYIKVSIQGKNSNGDNTVRCDYYIYVDEKPKKEEPEADLYIYPSEIELGESFEYEGTAYGNDYTLNTVTVGFTYYSSEEKYSKKIATDTGYLRYTGLSTDEYDVYKKIQTGSNSYLTCTDETGEVTKQFYLGYVGIYTITLYAGSNEYYNEYEEVIKTTVRIDVLSPKSEIVGDINGDGKITNKDRFLLNRFLAGMTGYTDIDKTLADINGDGFVNTADVEYLSRHLAGWVGYEKLPEISGSNNECQHNQYTDVYQSLTWVNNTIKTNSEHSYYEIYCRICNDCGGNLGKVQSDIISGAHKFNADGVCACGAISDTVAYVRWNGINSTGKKIYVYETPYSTDTSYGQLFVDEEVVVLGCKAGRYLIQYTVTGTSATKQGYVNTSSIQSNSNYNIEFEFDTITLPVSGRTVLLIPMNGSAYYHLYNGNTLIWQEAALNNLVIEFEDAAACKTGTTTITGNNGGFGTLSVYYIENDNRIYLQSPDYYIVADSDEVYSSGNINIFSNTEKEYIAMAIDMYLTNDIIPLPYELEWWGIENFGLIVEELDNILSSILQRESPTQNDYASILAEFIKKYVEAEESQTTVDELDVSFAETITSFLDGLQFVSSDVVGEATDLLELIQSVNKLYTAKSLLPSELKLLFEDLLGIMKHHKFTEVVKSTPALKSAMWKALDKGISPSQLTMKLGRILKCDDFFKEGGIASKIGTVGTVLCEGKHIVEFAATMFSNYQRHAELLTMLKIALVAIPTEEKNNIENYDIILGSINLLLEKYDQKFMDKLNENLSELAANTTVWATNMLISYACPGLIAVQAVAKVFVSITDTREEANMIRMRMFYSALEYALMDKFTSLYNDGQTFSEIYAFAPTLVRMYLNMALYINGMASDVHNYSKQDKETYEKNIETINRVFEDYLDY